MDAKLDTARAWVDVDLGALVANYRSLRDRANPRAGMLPVVKANAYGLGVGPVVRALEPLEPWGYGVAAVTEGIELRELGVRRPVLLLFATPDELEAAAGAGITPGLGDPAALRRWRDIARRLGRRLPFHLEIDTGIGRAGFLHDRIEEWLPAVLDASSSDLEWQGTLTHFHSPEEDEAATREQWERFDRALSRIPAGQGGLRHACGSAAAMRWPEYAADLIRPGIYLYGGDVAPAGAAPRPVAEVRARAVAVRDVPAGWPSSYGATYRARGPARWATLAIGYGDGLRRELSNAGEVRFGERLAPIVGRVCMDVTVVDVTDFEPPVQAGDIATVIGGPPDGPTGLDTVARRCGTISYEVLTGLSRRLPRRYPEMPAGEGTSR